MGLNAYTINLRTSRRSLFINTDKLCTLENYIGLVASLYPLTFDSIGLI